MAARLVGDLFERFAELTPVGVAVPARMEWPRAPETLDELFRQTASQPCQPALLFSTCVDLMAGVVCRTPRSVQAAYQVSAAAAGVSVQSRSDKLAWLEPRTASEGVRHTARRWGPDHRPLKGAVPPLAPGSRGKVRDGNHRTRNQRRLQPRRGLAAGRLPGPTGVVLEPTLGWATDVVSCADGHAPQRSRLGPIRGTGEAGDWGVADRNFGTTGIRVGLATRGGSLASRQPASTLSWERAGGRRRAGRCGTAAWFEQDIWLQDAEGGTRQVRRLTLVLDRPPPEKDAGFPAGRGVRVLRGGAGQ